MPLPDDLAEEESSKSKPSGCLQNTPGKTRVNVAKTKISRRKWKVVKGPAKEETKNFNPQIKRA